MITRLLSVAALLTAFAAMPLTASAFIIDSFDDAQSVSADAGTPVDSNSAAGGMIGGDRTLTATYGSGPNSVDGEVDAGGSSLLNVSLGAATLGDVDLVYDGGGGGLGGVDFTVGGSLNAIAMEIPFDDLPVEIEIVALSLAGSSSLTLNPGGAVFAPISLPFLFSSFGIASGTGADFTSIYGLEINIHPLFPATDLQIDFIETVFESGVPEPATFVMAVLGLLGLCLIARRRR